MRRKMVLFAVGGTGYSMLEILYRGRTHWTMAVLGGLCLMLLASIVRRRPHWPLWKLSAAGAAVVTLAELAAGLLVNRILGWGVWDYSAQPLNLWGQICPRFSAYWLCLSYAACGVMRRFGGAERKKRRDFDAHAVPPGEAVEVGAGGGEQGGARGDAVQKLPLREGERKVIGLEPLRAALFQNRDRAGDGSL